MWNLRSSPVAAGGQSKQPKRPYTLPNVAEFRSQNRKLSTRSSNQIQLPRKQVHYPASCPVHQDASPKFKIKRNTQETTPQQQLSEGDKTIDAALATVVEHAVLDDRSEGRYVDGLVIVESNGNEIWQGQGNYVSSVMK
nr:uncharacterized protein LOC115259932 [Aedes albopictus]XP_029716586.1 uncharacterized protein LOC115259933 [Aedes albopictus]